MLYKIVDWCLARWSLFRFSAAPFLDLEWWNESTFGFYCTVVSNSWKHELRPNSWTNPDKSLKSFPPFYSLLPVQCTALPWDKKNFFKLTQPFMYFYSSVTEHCKSGKEENLIEKLTPFLLVYEIRTETSSLRILKIMPRNLNEIVRSGIRLLFLCTVCLIRTLFPVCWG